MMQQAKMTMSRSASAGGFQLKGLVLVIICGFYGLLLLLAAALVSRIASSIKNTVKSIMWKVEVTETETIIEVLDTNNNDHSRKRSPHVLCSG